MIINEYDDNMEDTNTLKNYVFESDDPSADAHYYDMEGMELVESDTVIYENDGDIDYVINNYYDADDIDFSYRINRFHRIGYYDPVITSYSIHYTKLYEP